MGRAGIEPATQTRRFYRPLPTPIGEPTQKVVQTGLEPANYTLERRAARPLRFCTINAKDLDLNPDQRFWRPLCCRYTIPAFGSSGESRSRQRSRSRSVPEGRVLAYTKLWAWGFAVNRYTATFGVQGESRTRTVGFADQHPTIRRPGHTTRTTGIEPVTTCLGNKRSFRLSYILIWKPWRELHPLLRAWEAQRLVYLSTRLHGDDGIWTHDLSHE